MADIQQTGIQASALAYSAFGWSVIPIEPRGKRPLLAWRDFQSRIATAGEIASWFRRWPDANVGVVTGRISGIVVVDVDAQHGGAQSVAQLIAEQGPLPRTPEVATGGRGRHLYFAHPGAATANRVALRPGIDLRADGGCVVAPPSVHPSGHRYGWLPGRAPGDVALAPLPAWFRAAARKPRPAGQGRAHWREITHDGVAAGQRNSTIASVTGHLLWHGVDPEVALELMLAWNRTHCRPPLADAEVTAVVHSITRLHERERDADSAEPH